MKSDDCLSDRSSRTVSCPCRSARDEARAACSTGLIVNDSAGHRDPRYSAEPGYRDSGHPLRPGKDRHPRAAQTAGIQSEDPVNPWRSQIELRDSFRTGVGQSSSRNVSIFFHPAEASADYHEQDLSPIRFRESGAPCLFVPEKGHRSLGPRILRLSNHAMDEEGR